MHSQTKSSIKYEMKLTKSRFLQTILEITSNPPDFYITLE